LHVQEATLFRAGSIRYPSAVGTICTRHGDLKHNKEDPSVTGHRGKQNSSPFHKKHNAGPKAGVAFHTTTAGRAFTS
jgi:hypothetical protein